MAYFDLSKLNLAYAHLNPNYSGNRSDKVALRITCIKNVKFKILKIRTGCQYVGYLHYNENRNWAAQNLRQARPWV